MFKVDLDLKNYPASTLASYVETQSDGYQNFVNSEFFLRVKTLPVFGIHDVRHDNLHAWKVSYEVYETTRYWWVLLFYNDLIDPYGIPAGTAIRYPEISSLEKLFYDLRTKETVRQRSARLA